MWSASDLSYHLGFRPIAVNPPKWKDTTNPFIKYYSFDHFRYSYTFLGRL